MVVACEFGFSIGQEVYFLDQGDIKSDKIEYGQIHMTKDGIQVKYKLRRRNSCNVQEETLSEDVNGLLYDLEKKAKAAGYLMNKKD